MMYHVTTLAPSEWDRHLELFDERTVFHTSDWLKSIGASYAMRPILAAACDEQSVVAVWPCLETRRGPLRVLGSPFPGTSTAYLGPLFRKGCDPIPLVQTFLEDRVLGRYSFFSCRIVSGMHEVDLRPLGFDLLQHFETYLLDVTQDESVLWTNLKRNCRNHIRKARKSGYRVQTEDDPSFLDQFWTMSEIVFARTNRKPSFSRRFLIDMWGRLADRNRAVAISAFLDDQRVGTLILPCNDHTMYCWASGSLREHAARGINNLLHWEAIKLAKAAGLRRYDFISSKGGPGRFKKTFGPFPCIAAVHWEHCRSRTVRWLRNGYESYARYRNRLRS